MRTDFGELYVYAGYYEGSPRSIYERPDEGYLYIFFSPSSVPATPGRGNALGFEPDDVVEQTVDRLRDGHVDGNACYTRTPKRFRERVAFVDLSPAAARLAHAFGLRRVGDRRPKRPRT